MSTGDKAAGPGRRRRIAGYDMARAIAICLMILENFKVLMLGNREAPHALVWAAGLTDGRSAPLFVALAGVGISLMSKGALESDAVQALRQIRWVQLRRALFFLVLGNLFILIWFMDILHFYAVYIALASVLFLRASRRLLIFSSAAVIAASTVELVWRGEAFIERFSYWTPTGVLRDTFLDGIHPVLPWLAFVLFGMWLGRLELSDPGRRRKLLCWSLAVAFGAEILSDGLNLLAFTLSASVVPESFPHLWGTRLTPPGPLYVVSSSATSAAAIALCLELAERFPPSSHRLTRALVSAGQISLTLYLAHAIVGAGLLWVIEQLGSRVFGTVLFWGYGRLEDQSITFLLCYFGVYTLVSLLFADWYRRRFKLGPLEWVMRQLTGSGPRLPTPSAIGDSFEKNSVNRPLGRLGFVVVVMCCLWLVFVAFMGLTKPRASCPPDESSFVQGETIVDELTVLCHERWFEIHVPQDDLVTFEARAGIDTYLELFNHDGSELIGEDDDTGPGYNPLLEIPLQAGRYRMLVRPYRADSGPFTIHVR